jgi:hypothetical protein
MSEVYNSSHTGPAIDDKVQSLIDWGNIYEGKLTPGLLDKNNTGPIDQGIPRWIFDCNEEYNWMRYSVIGNICFLTFHLKIKVTQALQLIENNCYAALNGLPFTSLHDTAFSVYELGGTIINHDGGSLTPDTVLTVQGGSNCIRLENHQGIVNTTWKQTNESSTRDIDKFAWVGGSGFYFIQR